MSTCGYADESARPGRYVMSLVVVDDANLTEFRRELRGAVGRRQRRIHMHAERDPWRREILNALAGMPFEALAWTVRSAREPAARAECLSAMVAELQRREVPRLVLESRQDDRADAVMIAKARRLEPPLRFEHLPPNEEPALWAADAVAWVVSGGPRWSTLLRGRLIEP